MYSPASSHFFFKLPRVWQSIPPLQPPGGHWRRRRNPGRSSPEANIHLSEDGVGWAPKAGDEISPLSLPKPWQASLQSHIDDGLLHKSRKRSPPREADLGCGDNEEREGERTSRGMRRGCCHLRIGHTSPSPARGTQHTAPDIRCPYRMRRSPPFPGSTGTPGSRTWERM